MKRLRSIIALSLALLILVASVGVTVNQHLCGGQVQSTAIFVKAAPCGMMKLMAHASHAKKPHKKCCDERSSIFKSHADTAELAAASEFTVSPAVFLAILPFLGFTFSSVPAEPAAITFAFQKPPSSGRDIVVHFRSIQI